MYVSMCMCMCDADASGVQKRASDPFELELQVGLDPPQEQYLIRLSISFT